MRRLAILALCLASMGVSRPDARQVDAPDTIGVLLTGLQAALRSGQVVAFLETSAPGLPGATVSWLAGMTGRGVTEATVRERARTRDAVLVDVFLARGAVGRLASWEITLWPAPPPSGPRIRSIAELTAFTNLIHLRLDTSRQFAVRDLTVSGTDFTVTMSTGVAFVADADGSPTALVLRGRARVSFAPPSATEQGQLRIFNGQPTLDIAAEDLFVRVNAREIDAHVTRAALAPVPVDRRAAEAAQAVFAARAPRSYHFDLADLSADRWSLEPLPGSTVVDFRTSRFGWLTYARTPDDAEDVSLFNRDRHLQVALYASPERLATHGPFYSDDDDASYEVRHVDVDLRIDPRRAWLSGRASLQIVLRRPVASVLLRLAESLVVSSVSSPDVGGLLALRPSGQHSVVVGLPVRLTTGGAVTIDVQYHGRLDPQVLEREAMAVAPDEAQEGLDLSALIEPRFLYSSRDAWYPQPRSRRHATATMRFTVPDQYDVVASGDRGAEVMSVATDAQPGSSVERVRTVEYRAARPIRYLAFLVSRLVSTSRAETPVPVQVVSTPGQTRPRIEAGRVAAVLAYYAGLVGDVPYSSFTVAALQDRLPGGHSPAYFALLNQPHPATPFTWSRDPVAFDDAPEFFLAHEVAHQWWGQAVGIRNYHEQWISEGFAHYLAWRYVESTAGPATAARLMRRMRDTALALSSEGPVYLGYRVGHIRNDARAFRGIVYNKTAVVLHMLQQVIGEDAFGRGLRRLFAERRFTLAGYQDVVSAFQAETSFPVDRFLARWILGADVPELRVRWQPGVAGRGVVRVEQSGDVFDLPLTVTVELADGRREQVRFTVTDASHEFPLDVPGRIRGLAFDDNTSIVRLVR